MSDKPKPSHAPIYAACVYPEMAELFRRCGYALAVHGSMQRDFDLIAVPWVDSPTPCEKVVRSITETWDMRVVGEIGEKPHGRRVWTLSLSGSCFLDLSFFPTEGGAA